MLAVYIQYKILFQNVHSPTLHPKGSQKLSNRHIFFLIVGKIYPIQKKLYLYSDLRNTCQLYLYILVLDMSYQQLGEMCQLEGFCAPRNVHLVIYIFALDICCQHLGNICQLEGFCAPFGRKVTECTFCNIYIICICIGYMLPTF